MSSVYEALHLGLKKIVALKVLHSSSAGDDEALSRLRHEAQVVSAIGHAGICEIYDLGHTQDGRPYLVMERLVGETLGSLIERRAPMDFVEVAPVLKQALAALAAAHGKGILHRDLKPENVFLEQRSGKVVVKLLDFGISKWMRRDPADSARLSLSDAVMGTPYYMAPEQARGDGVLDQRVDLWAAGVVLYEALSGRRPFVATNYNALLVKILTSQPRAIERFVPATHPEVGRLVTKALAKLREDRFQTAREFRYAVTEAEEACVSEDSHAPTRVMRPRLDSRAALGEICAGPQWEGLIEDPATCVDDELTKADEGRIATEHWEAATHGQAELPHHARQDAARHDTLARPHGALSGAMNAQVLAEVPRIPSTPAQDEDSCSEDRATVIRRQDRH